MVEVPEGRGFKGRGLREWTFLIGWRFSPPPQVLQWPSHRGRLHAELRAPSGDPELGSGDPEVGSGDPEVGSGDPEVGSRDPEVGSGDPEMGSADPEEGSREPGPALCVTFDPWGSRLAVGHHGGVCAVHGTPWGEGGPPLTPL